MLPLAFAAVFYEPFTAAKQIVLAGGAAAAAVVCAATARRIPLTPLWWPLAFLSLACALAFARAVRIDSGLNLLAALVLFAAALCAMERQPERDTLALLVTAAGVLEAVLVLCQAAAGDPLFPTAALPGKWRAFGTFGNPNWTGEFLAMALLVTLGRLTGRWSRTGIAALALIASALAATFARGAWAACAAGLAAIVLARGKALPRKLTLALAAALAGALAVGAALAFRADTLPYLTNVASVRGRLWMGFVTLRLIAENPLGVGLGNFGLYFPNAQARCFETGFGRGFLASASFTPHAHNDYLELAAEAGIPALAALAALVWMVARRGRRLASDGAALGLWAAAVAMLANALAASPLYLPGSLGLTAVFLGAAEAAAARFRPLAWSRVARAAVCAAALAACAWTWRWCARRAAAEYALQRAATAISLRSWDTAAAELGRAAAGDRSRMAATAHRGTAVDHHRARWEDSMRSRWLYLTIACLAVFLFAGNYWAVKSQARCPEPGNCQCVVTISKSGSSASSNPSCSVTWALGSATKLKNCDVVEPGTFDRIIMCDTGRQARLRCRGGEFFVAAGTATRLSCDESGDYPTIKATHEDSWENNVGNRNTNASPDSDSLAARWLARIRAAVEGEQRHRIITETEAVTVINGDAGVTMHKGRPRVMVTAGEAIVESFCNGAVQRLAAPAVATLPNTVGDIDFFSGAPLGRIVPCEPDDLSGRWRGAFNRFRPDGDFDRLPLTLDIRGRSGTVETPDGTLDITDFSFSSGAISLTAKARSGTGRFALRGRYDKGGMSLLYSESGMGGDGRRSGSGTGVAERLYIAQWAVPRAPLNTEYRHSLLALSPSGPAGLAWSVVEGSLPPGLALDGATGTIAGAAAAEGEHKFTVEVRDANGDTFRQPLSLRVAKLVLTNPLLPAAVIGQEYRYKLEMAGGQPPYQFRNDFALPFIIPGLPAMPSITPEGEISYQPASEADEGGMLMLTVMDAAGATQRMTLMIETRGVTAMGSAILPAATAGVPYRYQFQSAGQSGEVVWEDVNNDLQDTGFALDEKTGELSGTPSAAGIVTLRVTAASGKSEDTRSYMLPVEAPAAAASEECRSCGLQKRR